MGKLSQTIECCECGNQSVKTVDYLDLGISMESNDLQDLVDKYEKTEDLIEQNDN